MEWIITIIIVASLLIAGLIVWTILSNVLLKTTNYEIKSEKLPTTFDGFKIAHVSDFHNDKKLGEKLVCAIKKSSPDIIVITGDLIDSRKTNTVVAINFISKITEIAPIYYVVGNHESRISEYKSFEKDLLSLGVKVLRNKKEEILRNNDKLIIAGVDDPNFDKTSKNEAYVMDKTLQSLDLTDDFNIVLSHRPELFEVYATHKADVVFCGHAHGGQFRVFGRGLYAPQQGFFPRFTSSIHKKSSTNMVVSKGIGNSAFPFRFNNRPELVVVTIKSKKN